MADPDSGPDQPNRSTQVAEIDAQQAELLVFLGAVQKKTQNWGQSEKFAEWKRQIEGNPHNMDVIRGVYRDTASYTSMALAALQKELNPDEKRMIQADYDDLRNFSEAVNEYQMLEAQRQGPAPSASIETRGAALSASVQIEKRSSDPSTRITEINAQQGKLLASLGTFQGRIQDGERSEKLAELKERLENNPHNLVAIKGVYDELYRYYLPNAGDDLMATHDFFTAAADYQILEREAQKLDPQRASSSPAKPSSTATVTGKDYPEIWNFGTSKMVAFIVKEHGNPILTNWQTDFIEKNAKTISMGGEYRPTPEQMASFYMKHYAADFPGDKDALQKSIIAYEKIEVTQYDIDKLQDRMENDHIKGFEKPLKDSGIIKIDKNGNVEVLDQKALAHRFLAVVPDQHRLEQIIRDQKFIEQHPDLKHPGSMTGRMQKDGVYSYGMAREMVMTGVKADNMVGDIMDGKKLKTEDLSEKMRPGPTEADLKAIIENSRYEDEQGPDQAYSADAIMYYEHTIIDNDTFSPMDSKDAQRIVDTGIDPHKSFNLTDPAQAAEILKAVIAYAGNVSVEDLSQEQIDMANKIAHEANGEEYKPPPEQDQPPPEQKADQQNVPDPNA